MTDGLDEVFGASRLAALEAGAERLRTFGTEISDLRRLRVEPGEFLLVTVPARCSAEQLAHVVRVLREALPPDMRVLVVSDDVELKVSAGAAETPEAFERELSDRFGACR